MVRAIEFRETDYTPCSFMSFSALRNRLDDDMYKLCKAELEMGLDSMLFLPYLSRRERPNHPDLRGLPVRFHPDVKTEESREVVEDDFDILHKEYITPGGKLTTSVQLSEDWPHGDHIPFIDDYQIARSLKPLITEPEDLEALQFLLQPPTEYDKVFFAKESRRAHDFVEENHSLLASGWGVGMDMANWLCGMEELMLLTTTETTFVESLFDMIHNWNLSRMELILSAHPDLFIRRSWYEGCDFVLPGFYERVILPRLKKEVELVHERGARFGYICSSGLEPMLDLHKEAGFDVLIGIDPVQGTHTDMERVKTVYDGEIAIWGGVSGAITVELGTEEEIQLAVQTAITKLGPDGFILSPVDNITVDQPLTWKNVDTFIEAWKKNRKHSA
jgi:hypothetical protein